MLFELLELKASGLSSLNPRWEREVESASVAPMEMFLPRPSDLKKRIRKINPNRASYMGMRALGILICAACVRRGGGAGIAKGAAGRAAAVPERITGGCAPKRNTANTAAVLCTCMCAVTAVVWALVFF